MKLNKNIIKKLIGMAKNVHTDEIGCDECYDQIHEFAEMKLHGKEPEIAMPLVQDHLNKCGECREEFQALLDAMQSLEH